MDAINNVSEEKNRENYEKCERITHFAPAKRIICDKFIENVNDDFICRCDYYECFLRISKFFSLLNFNNNCT